MSGKIEFGSWKDGDKIYSAIRFPVINGGEMLVQICMPEKAIAGAPASQVSRLTLGVALGALGAQEMVEGEAKKSAAAVNAILDALDKSKEDGSLMDALKKSSDEDIIKALKFLAL